MFWNFAGTVDVISSKVPSSASEAEPNFFTDVVSAALSTAVNVIGLADESVNTVDPFVPLK